MEFPELTLRSPAHLFVDLGQDLRDDNWAFIGGRLQTLLGSPIVSKVDLDFSTTRWADPLPLLSIACLISREKSRRPSLSVRTSLGSIKNNERDRFLIFASLHGFTRLFSSFSVLRLQGQTFSTDTLPELDLQIQKSKILPAYVNAECIKAEVLRMSGQARRGIADTVDRLVDEAVIGINRWMPNSSRQRLSIVHKLRQLLAEALDNIVEHAYNEEDAHGYGGVFARIRTGTPEDRLEFLKWSTARTAEREHCPALNRNNAARQPGWLEIFVCDVGCGLTTKLSADAKAPLLELGTRLFSEALSKERDRAAAGKTTVTGLQHIGLLLQNRSSGDRGDFVRVYSSGEWLGEHLPWPRIELKAGYRNFRGEVDQCLSGTALHFALEPSPAGREEQLLEFPKFFHRPSYEELESVRDRLETTSGSVFLSQFSILDLREEGNKSFDRGKRFAEFAASISGTVVIIRPSRSLRKADVLEEIMAIRTSAAQVRTIIYADLSPLLAIDIALVLQHQSLGSPRELTVVCITQDWVCAAFKVLGSIGNLTPDKDLARAFILGSESQIAAPELASILRDADTKQFWETLGDAYLNEPVVWSSSTGEPIELVGYIDIPIAMSWSTAFDSARRAARRAIAAFAIHRVITSDAITSSYLGDEFETFDGMKSVPWAEDSKSVGVGSILVSGSTSQRIGRRFDVNLVGWVHLMRHPMATSAVRSLVALLWTPPTTPPRVPLQRFERIAGSAFLIRGGESSIPLPRFDTPASRKLGKSLYGSSPNEMYDYWQRLQILRMGHWTYSRHHDLITVDLAQALEFEVGGQGPVIPWITKILTSWSKEFTNKGILVVYPRNRVTDKLKRLLQSGAGNLPEMFSLQATSSSSVSPLMISPIERERLGGRLRARFKDGGLIVQLDDGEITGRTMEQLTQVIQGLWEALKEIDVIPKRALLEIRSLALVDRRGTPNQRRLVKLKTKYHPRLWRWDVPTLGYDGRCPLCSTLDRCRDFKSRVPEGLHRARLQQWIESWSVRPVDQLSMEKGLSPKAIPDGDWTRFGMERLGDGTVVEHRVRHNYSTSRAAIAVEICRSTTRKDYPLQKAKGGRFRNGSPMDVQTRIEIIVAQTFLFWEELSFMDRIERLNRIVDLLWECSEVNNATSLAALCLQLDSSTVSTVWQHIVTKVEKGGFPNDDALLAAVMIDASRGTNQINQQDHKSWSLFQVLRRSSTRLRESLSRIFQVFGWSELSIHGGVLIDLLKTAPPVTERELSRTILMLRALASALNSLTPEMVARTSLDPAKDSRHLLQFVNRLEEISRKLVNSGELAPDTNPSLAAVAYLSRDEAQAEVSDELKSIYEFLFVGRPSLQLSYNTALTVEISSRERNAKLVDDAIYELIHKWNDHVKSKQPYARAWLGRMPPDIVHVPDRAPDKPLYVYRDSIVFQAILELLSNVVHSTKPISCPWPGSSGGVADMWTKISSAENGTSVTIELANAGSGVGEGQVTECGIRETVSSLHIRNLGGGGVSCKTDAKTGIFYTFIEIPTLAGLAWHGGRDEV
ncbi:hypothetical protein ACQR1I_21905 [Bradyrhizobium sp. HKCCYLS2038]|uniref:hypothetical protein n=1 Tax=unclassified Bradyrhizobium TaxID=2631580 RepID=UPI003EB6CBD6